MAKKRKEQKTTLAFFFSLAAARFRCRAPPYLAAPSPELRGGCNVNPVNADFTARGSRKKRGEFLKRRWILWLWHLGS